MGFFTAAERAELGKSAERERGVQRRPRELVRDDFAPRRRPAANDVAGDGGSLTQSLATGDVGSLTQRLAKTSLREIDDLIVQLESRREQLLSESARMQREVAEYAKLSQSTTETTKIISESLAFWKKGPDAPGVNELRSSEDRKTGSSEALAEPSKDHETFGGQAEVSEIPGIPTLKTT